MNLKYIPDILIVDDTPENLKLLSQMLRDNGYNARTIPNGLLAIKSLENRVPDLILLDINMPGMSGFEVCEKIKSLPFAKEIPIIFISALNDVDDKVRAFDSGGVDYITKPFQVKEVLSRVNTHLKIRSLQKGLQDKNLGLEHLVEEKVREIEESQLATLIAMIKLAEARDDDTGKHIERTRTFCKIIATDLMEHCPEMNITPQFIKTLYNSSPLHDIGKIAIPDNILLKPGKLDFEEFEIMKTHTSIGADNLIEVFSKYPNNQFLERGIEIAMHHHERWDGTGYPHGLWGETIPLSARIMALADVYDALRSKRVYKEEFSHEMSREIIIQGSGKHFDPRIVDAFIRLEDQFVNIRKSLSD